jgi:bile acid:Na+ symporter, BASS family
MTDVGVGLVIVTGSFAGTPAVTPALTYGILEVLGSLLVALWWRRAK